jgi:surfactin synthase thioesterase subunit
VLYPERGQRIHDPLPKTLTALAESYVRENESILKGGYIVFSHCTGALLAYEVVRCAKELLGIEPLGFIASCSASPSFSLFKDDVSTMDDSTFLKLLLDTGRIDEETAKLPNFCEYYLPILKKDFILVQDYHPKTIEKLSCPFNTVTATNDSLVEPYQVADWQNYSNTEVINTIVEGEHFYLEKDVEWVCNYVNGLIDGYLR